MSFKLLLVGPYPPPHGGISVHVRTSFELLTSAGVSCQVLNPERPPLRKLKLLTGLLTHACSGWTFHIHTNGHNPKSWLVALAGGVASRLGAGGLLTLHSGLLPDYLRTASRWRRGVAWASCCLYRRVVCVNEELARSILALGIPSTKLTVMAAHLPLAFSSIQLPAQVDRWISARRPVISTALFFRPEYAFELLVEGIERIRSEHPELGCIVMGDSGGRVEAEALLRQRGLTDNVLLLGDVSHKLCLTVMSRSNLFVRATHRDGDALSVREALSLGVPVVASDVGNRPPGTLLFRAGDVDGLVSAMELGLAQRRSDNHEVVPQTSLRRLLELYG